MTTGKISSINIYLGIIQCSVRPINEIMIEISKRQKTCHLKNTTRTHCPMNCRRHKSATGVQASGHLVEKSRKLWQDEAARCRKVENDERRGAQLVIVGKDWELDWWHQDENSSAWKFVHRQSKLPSSSRASLTVKFFSWGTKLKRDWERSNLVAKFVTNACGAIWWPNLQPMQVALSGGHI